MTQTHTHTSTVDILCCFPQGRWRPLDTLKIMSEDLRTCCTAGQLILTTSLFYNSLTPRVEPGAWTTSPLRDRGGFGTLISRCAPGRSSTGQDPGYKQHVFGKFSNLASQLMRARGRAHMGRRKLAVTAIGLTHMAMPS